MKRTLFTIASLLLGAATASAAGINLSWNDCGAFGAARQTFACDTNAGPHVLVGSFVAPAGIDSMSGHEVVIDVQSACPVLPEWWKMRAGFCRAGALGYSFDFTGGTYNCYDYWQGGALGLMAMDAPAGNRARIKAVIALPAGDGLIGPIAEGTEVYSLKAIINSTKTVGLGACEGCQIGTCIIINSINVYQGPALRFRLTNPDLRQIVTWQSAQFWYGDFGGPDACVDDCPVPARARTWGQIKSLYR